VVASALINLANVRSHTCSEDFDQVFRWPCRSLLAVGSRGPGYGCCCEPGIGSAVSEPPGAARFAAVPVVQVMRVNPLSRRN